ncbi:MAG: hypothetical protein GY856_44510 [bacterium]|nr:hypothetical protein [bacterium]
MRRRLRIRWLIREKLAGQPQRTDPRIERFLAAAGAVSAAGEGEVSALHDRYLYGDRAVASDDLSAIRRHQAPASDEDIARARRAGRP